MPTHENDLQKFLNQADSEKKFSDDYYFYHEGVNYLAKFQIPSKVWFFYNQDIPLYHGSQSDS